MVQLKDYNCDEGAKTTPKIDSLLLVSLDHLLNNWNQSLLGYSGGDSCENIPSGYDKHNHGKALINGGFELGRSSLNGPFSITL